MTTPGSPDRAAPLRTDADVLERVRTLIGPATVERQLWLLLVDGDQRQTPVVLPIEDVPARPDDMLDGLGTVLTQIAPDLETPAGPGSAVFVLERQGPDDATPDDEAWAAALVAMCERADMSLRGVHASTPNGVLALR